MTTAFWCAHCSRVCCWECLRPDDTIQVIKTIGSRYCNASECLEAERKECDCATCRNCGPGHRKDTGRACQHRMTVDEALAIADDESDTDPRAAASVLAAEVRRLRADLRGADPRERAARST